MGANVSPPGVSGSKFLETLIVRAAGATVASLGIGGAQQIDQLRALVAGARPPGVIVVSCPAVWSPADRLRWAAPATTVAVVVSDPALLVLNIIGDESSLESMFPHVSRNGVLQMIRVELARQPEVARGLMWSTLIADALSAPAVKAQLAGNIHIMMPQSALTIEGWAGWLAALGARGV